MHPARSPAGTLYFNRRVQRPARNDQSIRRTPNIVPCRSPRLPPPACAAARVGQAVTRSGCGTGSCYAGDYAAPADGPFSY